MTNITGSMTNITRSSWSHLILISNSSILDYDGSSVMVFYDKWRTIPTFLMVGHIVMILLVIRSCEMIIDFDSRCRYWSIFLPFYLLPSRSALNLIYDFLFILLVSIADL